MRRATPYRAQPREAAPEYDSTVIKMFAAPGGCDRLEKRDKWMRDRRVHQGHFRFG